MFADASVPAALILLSVAVLGLIFGSFLNVCIARLPWHRSIVRPRSACPRCGAAIQPRDNLPLLSYMLLRGRCRGCRDRISARYPLVELALAALWVLCALRMPAPVPAVEAAALCFLLLGLAVMDIETMRLPDSFTLPGAAAGFALSWLPAGGLIGALHLAAGAPFPLPRLSAPAASLSAALGAAGLLWSVRAAYQVVRRREGMGLGDVKLALLLGAWLGIAGAGVALFLGILLAAAVGVAVLRRRGASGRLPLGAFLCLGAGIALFAGRPVLDWYFSFWR